MRVAVGVEPELWPKIRVPIGEGIARFVDWYRAYHGNALEST